MSKFDLEEAVHIYGPKLFRYVYTLLCNYQDAEDIVQDVFISAYHGQVGFDGENISAWLYKIAYNKSIDHLRRNQVVSFQELHEDTSIVEQDYDTGCSPVIISAIQNLSYEERVIVLGRITESLSYAELAVRLGISEPVVRKRYERAKKKLAKNLQRTEREVF